MHAILRSNHSGQWLSQVPRIRLAIPVALLIFAVLSDAAWGRSLCSATQEESETAENTVSVTFIVEGMMKSKSGAT